MMEKLKKLFAKLKKSDYLLLFVAFIGCVVFVCLLFVNDDNAKKASGDFSDYCNSLENRLEKVLSKIDGCGDVSVAITYSSGSETVYAYETQSKTTNGVTTQENKIVTIGGNPLVIKENSPNIIGVVIVADGGGDAVIRLQLKQAVVTLLNVDASNVQVFSSKGNGGTKND